MQRQHPATFGDSWKKRLALGQPAHHPLWLMHRFAHRTPPQAAGPAGSQARATWKRKGAIALLSSALLLSALSIGSEHTTGFAGDLMPNVTPLSSAEVVVAPADSPTDQSTTQPSSRFDPPPPWVETVRSTDLWSSQQQSLARLLMTVPQQTLLRVLGQIEQGRLPVYLDGTGSGGARLGAWVDTGNVKPSDRPPRVAASSRGGNRPTPDISTPEKFIAAVAEAAQDSQRDSRVPASVTIAQAILESDWGNSLLAKKGQNYFGIKATKGPGTAGVIRMSTWEVLSGKNVVVTDGFRAYNTLYESVMDHGRFLADNPRYAAAFQVLNDPREFARRIQAAGYATDPAYSMKLINLINKYNLIQYDLPLP